MNGTSGGLRVWQPGAQAGSRPAGGVSADARDKILAVAATITTRRNDPGEVLESAGPMLEWVGEAPTKADQALRLSALTHQALNEGDARCRSMGAPVSFVAKATVLYAFMTGDGAP
jgi:hypothetical protein